MIDLPPTPPFARALFFCSLLSAFSGCATRSEEEIAPVSLASTQWELVTIQSMDDAQGTTRIDPLGLVTASFSADGQVSFKLDCNRGMASWKATPSTDGTSGTLQFGPIAATRAMCPPPHLDERVARDLAYARTYRYKDGNLYITLMADGGIYEWRPVSQ